MSEHHRTRTIEIPERTAQSLANRIEGTEFDSVDDYAAFALDQLLDEIRRQHPTSEQSIPDSGTEPDRQESVEDRLESLGYL